MREHAAVAKLLADLTHNLANKTTEVANLVTSEKAFESLRLANLSLLEAASNLQTAAAWEVSDTPQSNKSSDG